MCLKILSVSARLLTWQPAAHGKLTASKPLMITAVRKIHQMLYQKTVHNNNASLLKKKLSLFDIFRKPLSSSVKEEFRSWTMVNYICAFYIFVVGASYAGVPVYQLVAKPTGLGAQKAPRFLHSRGGVMATLFDRPIRVRFNADRASSIKLSFRAEQTELIVLPGETALAFYTAKNSTDIPITGVAGHDVVPYDAAQYFGKILCFCFDEVTLQPGEQIDLPVFFYIDPSYNDDPRLETVDDITLSYTFFEAKKSINTPLIFQ